MLRVFAPTPPIRPPFFSVSSPAVPLLTLRRLKVSKLLFAVVVRPPSFLQFRVLTLTFSHKLDDHYVPERPKHHDNHRHWRNSQDDLRDQQTRDWHDHHLHRYVYRRQWRQRWCRWSHRQPPHYRRCCPFGCHWWWIVRFLSGSIQRASRTLENSVLSFFSVDDSFQSVVFAMNDANIYNAV